MLVLLLFALLMVYGLAVAVRCRNHFGRLVAMGVTVTVLLYVFINTAMVMGLIPVVGVPLPLISYGGSSMIAVSITAGFVLALTRRRPESRAQPRAVYRPAASVAAE